jgi:hypothetical protein
MANGRAKPPEKTGLGAFIYNKEKGTCLGRTANSWCEFLLILVGFNLIFRQNYRFLHNFLRLFGRFLDCMLGDFPENSRLGVTSVLW